MSALSRHVIVVAFLLTVPFISQSVGQTEFAQHQGPLRNNDYGKLLDRLQADLGTWETALQKIDPGREGVPYKEGKLIESNQNVGLLQISNLRTMIHHEKQHRSVSGELYLGTFLAELSTDFYTLSIQGAFNNVSVEAVGGYGAEIGAMQKSFTQDGMDRVKAMEASSCVGSTE
jgi:hypothetical protein